MATRTLPLSLSRGVVVRLVDATFSQVWTCGEPRKNHEKAGPFELPDVPDAVVADVAFLGEGQAQLVDAAA